MKDLRKEYRATKRMTQAKLDELKQKRDAIVIPDGVRDISSELTPPEREAVRGIEEEIETVRTWLSNINFSLRYMNLGHHPGQLRGIERRAAYEREVPFEPYWIQRRQATGDVSDYEVAAGEDTDLAQVSQEQKEQIIKAMMKNVTPRQQDIIQLASNGYTHEEIAAVLGVHKGTIARTMSRVKEKIAEEGWFIL